MRGGQKKLANLQHVVRARTGGLCQRASKQRVNKSRKSCARTQIYFYWFLPLCPLLRSLVTIIVSTFDATPRISAFHWALCRAVAWEMSKRNKRHFNMFTRFTIRSHTEKSLRFSIKSWKEFPSTFALLFFISPHPSVIHTFFMGLYGARCCCSMFEWLWGCWSRESEREW